jgi:hypothetical protein
MQVTFRRFPDHTRGHVVIQRDDHVVYRLDAGPITSAAPHDLVHFTAEDTMGVADGIWGAIAGGVVFGSMTHASGRRAPHATERSDELKRTYRHRLQYAELLGGLVEAAAHRPDADLPRLVRNWFPRDAPAVDAVAGAAAALRLAEERWRQLPVGGTLELHWPPHRRIDPLSARSARERGRGRAASGRR